MLLYARAFRMILSQLYHALGWFFLYVYTSELIRLTRFLDDDSSSDDEEKPALSDMSEDEPGQEDEQDEVREPGMAKSRHGANVRLGKSAKSANSGKSAVKQQHSGPIRRKLCAGNKVRRTILKAVTGFAEPGELIAIMGASGRVLLACAEPCSFVSVNNRSHILLSDAIVLSCPDVSLSRDHRLLSSCLFIRLRIWPVFVFLLCFSLSLQVLAKPPC